MAFTLKQREFLDSADHRWNFKIGATRSGKTYLDYFVIPKRIKRVSGLPGLVVILGNTKGTLQRNIIEPLQNMYGSILVSDIKSDNTAILFGEKCYCLGADKINQVNRIRGSSIKYCYGDEVATWHEDVFTMLKSRLDKSYSKFDGTLNPESPNHWVKKFLDSNADIYCQKYTIDDNPTLDPLFVENLKREYAGTVYYDRYILGNWANAEGVIYRAFADSIAEGGDLRFLWKEEIPNLIEVNIGVDFGGNGSKHAFVATGALPGYSGVIVLASRRSEPGTPQELDSDFIEFCQTVFSGWGRIDHIYCDSAEQVLIRGMQQALRSTATAWMADRIKNAAKIEINDRIRLTSILMGGGCFWYLPSAASARDALATALWNGKHPGKDERLDDGSTDIDTLDALEYTIERNYKRFLKARGHI